MKKFINVFMMGILGLFIVCGCSAEDKKTVLSDAVKFKMEYEELNNVKNEKNGKEYRKLSIDEDNPFVYKSDTDIVEMMDNKETFVVYFGFASCPWCRSVIEQLINVANDLGIDSVYYVDVKEIRDTMIIDEDGEIVTDKMGTEGYYELLKRMDSVLEDYVLTNDDGEEVMTGEKRIYAPNIVAVVDGEVVQLTDGISDKQDDGYMKLTEEMKNESYDKIKCAIECVVDDKELCSAKTKC